MSDCIIWTRAKNNKGYGVVRVDDRLMLAHRVAYERDVGPIPKGLELDHLCRVPACVNPEHLEPVTHWENMHRSPHMQKPLEFCRRGHSKADGIRRPDQSGLICRECARMRQRAYKARQRALDTTTEVSA